MIEPIKKFADKHTHGLYFRNPDNGVTYDLSFHYDIGSDNSYASQTRRPRGIYMGVRPVTRHANGFVSCVIPSGIKKFVQPQARFSEKTLSEWDWIIDDPEASALFRETFSQVVAMGEKNI